jgi:hypothetical protein
MSRFAVQVSVEGFKPSNQDDAFHALSSVKVFLLDLRDSIKQCASSVLEER